jgi:hypothetical protein
MRIPPEVLATTDPKVLVEYAQKAFQEPEDSADSGTPEIPEPAKAGDVSEPDPGLASEPGNQVDLAEAVEETLVEGKALKKAERMRLVGRVEGLAQWAKYRGVRERLVNHLAEGVRRGYNVDQILDGVANEGYAGFRGLLTEAAADGAQ